MIPTFEASTFSDWGVTVQLITRTETTTDFIKSATETARDITAVVQPADKKKLNPDVVNWALRYYTFHTAERVDVGQFIEYAGTRYKIITDGNFELYGFSEVVGEQVR